MITPTARTLELLRKNGYLAGVVERHNFFAGPIGLKCVMCKKNRIGVTLDLFGWADIVAVPSPRSDPLLIEGQKYLAAESGTIYIQTTSRSNHSSRKAKILASPDAATVVRAGNKIWIVTWGQPRGYGTNWEVTVEQVTLAMIEEYVAPPAKPARKRKPKPIEEEE